MSNQQAPTAAKAEGLGPRQLRWMREVWASTIGKKVIVAVSGVVLAAYVIVHALGNLQSFRGDGDGGLAPIDDYAEWLRTFGEPVLPRETVLWGVRAILLGALIIHLAGVYQLWLRNRRARPAGHPSKRAARSIASSTMIFSGLVLLGFIVFHVLHFTTRTIHPTPLAEGTVYANLYFAFQDWWMVAIYVVVMLGLGLHLWHALWSVTQTAGIDRPNRNPTLRRWAAITTLVVAIGFAAVPLAFAFDVLPEPGGSGAVAEARR